MHARGGRRDTFICSGRRHKQHKRGGRRRLPDAHRRRAGRRGAEPPPFLRLCRGKAAHTAHDARTAPPVLSAKNGRNSSMAAAQSRRPKVRLRRRASLSRLSSSAMDSSASPESSSSIETAKYFDMAFRESIFGYPLPDSHFEIAVRETYSACASSSCVISRPLRSA